MSKKFNKSPYCKCRRCKAARRRGLILGLRRFGRYDEYVPFAKFFRKGSRRPVDQFVAREIVD